LERGEKLATEKLLLIQRFSDFEHIYQHTCT
jgi:hypothetical protein